MAETPSSMLALGTKASYFELDNAHKFGTGKVSTAQLAGSKGMVLAFICNHCPYVLAIADALGEFSRDYSNSGIGLAAINANDVSRYPADSTDNMTRFAEQYNFAMPYLYDEDQSVARAYHAACTPDFYLFDKNMELVYRGQFDDARPGNNIPSRGVDIRAACDAVLAGRDVNKHQVASIGCSIKWLPENELNKD